MVLLKYIIPSSPETTFYVSFILGGRREEGEGENTIAGCTRSPYGTIQRERAERKRPLLTTLISMTMATFLGRGGHFL